MHKQITHLNVPSQNVVEPWVELNVVFVDVVVEVLCAQDFGNPYKLDKDTVLVKNSRGQQTPHI